MLTWLGNPLDKVQLEDREQDGRITLQWISGRQAKDGWELAQDCVQRHAFVLVVMKLLVLLS
jgi:hypothetical protein